MTAEEAGQIYYINLEIKKLEKELAELEDSRTYYRPVILTDMPKGGGEYRNVTDDFLERQKELRDMLDYALKKLQLERKRFEEFLRDVDDAELRLILRLRCVNNMSWAEIGEEVGCERTTASKKFYKFFRKQ